MDAALFGKDQRETLALTAGDSFYGLLLQHEKTVPKSVPRAAVHITRFIALCTSMGCP